MPILNTQGKQLPNLKVLMEHGTLRSGAPSYSIAHHAYTRCAYTIKLNGTTSATVENPPTFSSLLAYFYDENMAYLSYVELTYPSATITIPSNAHFMRFALEGVNEFKKELDCSFKGGTDYPVFVKNPKLNATGSEVFTFDVYDDVYSFGRMLLPPNYDAEGTPVPLILWMDGSGNMVGWGDDFASAKLPYLRYLRDEGFAVLSIFGWGSNYYAKYPNCGAAYPYPAPTNLKILKKGIEWVCDRYNIDVDEIHVMSKSQGGQCAYYFASRPICNFKSIGMFSPVLDYLSMPGEAMYAGTRKAVADDLELTGNVEYFTSENFSGYSSEAIAFWISNLHRIIGFNEAYTDLNGATALENVQKSLSDCAEYWTNEAWKHPDRTDIYNHHEYKKFAKIPVKIWGASDDNATPFFKMSEAISQLQNGGTEAVLRTFDRGTGGHNCADLGSTVTDVTTALGIAYTAVPVGWVENVEWIRQHMAK